MKFVKASRKQSKLRLALIGPSGSGKTMSALLIAKNIGKRVAVIDSECGSASKYAGDAADFDTLELESFEPRTYVEAIRAAESEGYDVIIIDSLSHAWAGKGGALEMKDAAAKRSKSGNTFDAWREVTPHHNALVDALIGCKAHLIVTMRAKTEYVLEENDRGKKVPRKVGMAPIQRDGLEYEFDVVAELDHDHNFMVSKTRCPKLDGQVITRPGKQVADILTTWLSDGAPVQEKSINENRNNTPTPAAAQAPAAAQSSEPAMAPGIDKDAAIKSLVEVDLPRCTTKDHLVAFARELLSVHGPVRATPAWKAFSEACAQYEVAPREAVNEASQP